MAIVIPSKSLYSPIENEKVRTPINSVFVTEIYTNPQEIVFLKNIAISGTSGNEEEVLMPISDYYQSTLKAVGELRVRLDYHTGEEKTDKYRSFYKIFNHPLGFNQKRSSNISFKIDETGYGIYVDHRIVSNELGVSCVLSFQTLKIAQSTSKYQEDIHLDSVQISFSVYAVKRNGEEIEKKYGETNYNNISFPSNELLQSSATVDRGLSGIRYYGIERANLIDYDINEGYRYEYKVVQGNDISSLSPVTDEAKRYVGWYHSDGKTVVNVYNLSENTEINKHNADFIRNVGFYWGIDYDEIPCTYSFMEDFLSVYIDSEVDLSLGFRVVLDFGENGWRKTENLSSVIAKGVLEQYGKGKETARIRCSTNDYYDENDELAISPTGKNELPMLFSINDEVIPMVTPDRAMSCYKDETPKVFRVVGVRFENRGALWQELTLQEK